MFTESKALTRIAAPHAVKHVWLWFLLAAVLCLPGISRADDQFTPAELDTLVSTIALYPDPLLVQVLAASVHGDEIPGASDWANQHRHLKGTPLAEEIKNQDLPYDASVQALIPFPTVLATMAKYQVWTDQLGDAVATQKEEVMDAVQRMRKAAYEHGHLQSNDQVKIIKEKTIIIEPVRKEYVYVPVYNPHVVYYVYSNGYPGLHYRSGVWLGGTYTSWGWGSSWFEWDTHVIYVHDYRWHHHHPRPHRPPRYHNPPPPRNDRYAVPPSRPAKTPMNHHTAPRNSSYAPAPQHSSQRSSANSASLVTTRQAGDIWVDDYAEQNRNQGFGNVKSSRRSSNQSYGNASSSRSSQRNYDDSRSSHQSRSSGNGGGFRRSRRK